LADTVPGREPTLNDLWDAITALAVVVGELRDTTAALSSDVKQIKRAVGPLQPLPVHNED